MNAKQRELLQKAAVDFKHTLTLENEKPGQFQLNVSIPVEKKTVKVDAKDKLTLEYFKMKPSVMTEQDIKDLHIIRNRHVIDPKRHYKKMDKLSSVYQVGRIIGAADESRRVKKLSIAQELLQDEKTKTYMKRRVGEVAAKSNNVTRKGFKKRARK